MFAGTSGLMTRQLHRQRGVVLLLIVLAMMAIGGVAILAGLSNATKSTGTSASEQASLQDLRQALFGYVLSNALSATAYTKPGLLPIPDSLADGSYDGGVLEAKCLSTGANGLPAAANSDSTQRCLGKWPTGVIPVELPNASRTAGAIDSHDPGGGGSLAGCIRKLDAARRLPESVEFRRAPSDVLKF